jgi:NAD(P)-dependent dehydrogenase (short-subunit alcohol dehydrogenase family)
VLIGDVSIKADVVRLIEELSAKEDHLDALVCNAGALADELKLTPDGVEQTFGCHLLFGSYLLSKLAKPLLEKAAEPRVVFVSSGG